jgi:hypothetical protein
MAPQGFVKLKNDPNSEPQVHYKTKNEGNLKLKVLSKIKNLTTLKYKFALIELGESNSSRKCTMSSI